MMLFSSQGIQNPIVAGFSRFFVPSSLVVIITALIVFMIRMDLPWSENEVPLRLLATCIVTFFLILSMLLWHENTKISSYSRSFLYILPLVYSLAFFFSFHPSFDLIITAILHGVAFIALLYIAPYAGKIDGNQKDISISYQNYFLGLSWTILMSFIVGISVMLLGLISIWSVSTLFGIDVQPEFFLYWITIALSLVAPMYFLTHIPVRSEMHVDRYDQNKFFSFLVRYVAIPFISIYFLILYAYSIKVLLNFHDWPNGMIAWMVVGFSVFGYMTYAFSRAYISSSESWVAKFQKYFPWIVLPQVLMLAYAIYLRIDQYGLTVNRYFVVIFGVWLFIISLYFCCSRKKELLFLPLSLSIAGLLVSVGPWSVTALPYQIQYDRLLKNLQEAGILVENAIVPLPDYNSIDPNLSDSIASEIEYLCQYHQCRDMKSLFQDVIGESASLHHSSSTWYVANAIQTTLRVQRLYSSRQHVGSESPYLEYYVDRSSMIKRFPSSPMSVSGYDSVLPLSGFVGDRGSDETYAFYDSMNSVFVYRDRGKESRFPITIPESLSMGGGGEVSGDLLIFDVENTEYSIRILFDGIVVRNAGFSGSISSDGDNLSYVISGYVLVKKK